MFSSRHLQGCQLPVEVYDSDLKRSITYADQELYLLSKEFQNPEARLRISTFHSGQYEEAKAAALRIENPSHTSVLNRPIEITQSINSVSSRLPSHASSSTLFSNPEPSAPSAPTRIPFAPPEHFRYKKINGDLVETTIVSFQDQDSDLQYMKKLLGLFVLHHHEEDGQQCIQLAFSCQDNQRAAFDRLQDIAVEISGLAVLRCEKLLPNNQNYNCLNPLTHWSYYYAVRCSIPTSMSLRAFIDNFLDVYQRKFSQPTRYTPY